MDFTIWKTIPFALMLNISCKVNPYFNKNQFKLFLKSHLSITSFYRTWGPRSANKQTKHSTVLVS